MTREIAKQYQKLVQEIGSYNTLDIGERRELRIDLQQKYGIPEIWAHNILNGFYLDEYLNLLSWKDVEKSIIESFWPDKDLETEEVDLYVFKASLEDYSFEEKD